MVEFLIQVGFLYGKHETSKSIKEMLLEFPLLNTKSIKYLVFKSTYRQ